MQMKHITAAAMLATLAVVLGGCGKAPAPVAPPAADAPAVPAKPTDNAAAKGNPTVNAVGDLLRPLEFTSCTYNCKPTGPEHSHVGLRENDGNGKRTQLGDIIVPFQLPDGSYSAMLFFTRDRGHGDAQKKGTVLMSSGCQVIGPNADTLNCWFANVVHDKRNGQCKDNNDEGACDHWFVIEKSKKAGHLMTWHVSAVDVCTINDCKESLAFLADPGASPDFWHLGDGHGDPP